MQLSQTFEWQGRQVRWGNRGAGPPVVLCHGTPWSSALWDPFADALSAEFSVHAWDMPGYGRASMEAEHRVSLDVQGRVLADLLIHWGLDRPHVIAHDYGGAVALRALLLHHRRYASLALVDVVALAPGGRTSSAWSETTPRCSRRCHPRSTRARCAPTSTARATSGSTPARRSCSSTPGWGLSDRRRSTGRSPRPTRRTRTRSSRCTARWICRCSSSWGTHDSWIPVERAPQLTAAIPGARLELVPDAGHLVQMDAPAALATSLHRWLTEQSR